MFGLLVWVLAGLAVAGWLTKTRMGEESVLMRFTAYSVACLLLWPLVLLGMLNGAGCYEEEYEDLVP